MLSRERVLLDRMVDVGWVQAKPAEKGCTFSVRQPKEPAWCVYIERQGSGTPWYIPKRLAPTPRMAMHIVAELKLSKYATGRWKWKDDKVHIHDLSATVTYGTLAADWATLFVSELTDAIYDDSWIESLEAPDAS